MKRGSILLALALLACSPQESAAPEIRVADAWARATMPGKSATAAYFTLSNSGGGDRLLTVSSPVGEARLHSTSMDGGVMRMRPLDSIEISSGEEVALTPGGTHVMITGLKQPIESGEELGLELQFERSGTVRVVAPVRSQSQAMRSPSQPMEH